MNDIKPVSSYLSCVSKLIELGIAPEYFPDIYHEFLVTVELAQDLIEFELSDDIHPAAVFQP